MGIIKILGVLITSICVLLGYFTSIQVAVAAFITLTVLAYIWGIQAHYTYSWIPGPEPELFYGNLRQITKEGECFYILRNMKKYGSVMKLVYGARVQIHITDPELLKEVMVKHFNTSFHSRRKSRFPGFGANLINQQGDHWRRSRRTLNPSFNTFNLSRFTQDINKAAKDAIDIIGEKCADDGSVEMFRTMGSVTMAVISSTSFGTELNQRETTEDHPLINAIIQFLEVVSPGASEAQMLISAFPILLPIFAKLKLGPIKKILGFTRTIADETNALADDMVQGGGISASQKRSFLNILINAKHPETGEKLEQSEIESQSFLFILAGYETTATALTFLIYCLAKWPEIEQKMIDEIDEHYTGDTIAYADLKKFKYMDKVVQEGLRLYPPAPMATRVCQEDIEIGGYKIPKGAAVNIPIWAVHHDDRNYPNPDEFDPERWDPESDEFKNRHPYAWIPFTEGPRKCIGYRFALEEIKIILANIYKKYRFEISPKTAEPLLFRPHVTLAPRGGVYVIPKKRVDILGK